MMPEDKKLLMVTISGPDRPGITAALSQVLMKHDVEIVDIEQASLQKLLGLYFLLDLGDASESKDSVIKDLLFEASQLNLNLNFKLFSRSEVEAILLKAAAENKKVEKHKKPEVLFSVDFLHPGPGRFDLGQRGNDGRT